MNARVIANAEKYYRSMVSFRDESWNLRDAHMVDTLESIMQFHGRKAKGIVWEHNTHVGDARYTDMRDDGLWNVGQLVREKNHEKQGVYIVGFASYERSEERRVGKECVSTVRTRWMQYNQKKKK